ncbi:MAG TPA: P-II family nitrogen regulator [Nitrososphaeraceae archaeon]|jgi:nitrogen regulatory protein P-II 1|nr:P-II family nitrogen regulator [Nitrososphaeraceae archaeon]
MKRIEAIVPNEKISAVSEALKKVGIGGCTVLEAKGRGKGEKPIVESGRGTSRFVSEFSVRANIVTVVSDSQVETVVNAILDSVSTGSPGDGKIFISPVSDTVDIGTKQRGEAAII